jgi:iron complex transport system permease protein
MVYGRISLVSLSVFLGILLAIAVCLGVLVGVSTYSPSELIFNPDAQDIALRLRLPRVLCSVLVGAGLAAVGMAYQALFRNYLASPFTLGVSSGAALAASAALVFGLSSGRGGLDIGAFALGGAILSIVVILAIARRLNRRIGLGVSTGDSSSLLLVGIVFSFFCSSVLTLIQYLADPSQLFQVTRWMMGGIPAVGWGDLVVGAGCAGVIIAWLWTHNRQLDLMLFGDDLAVVKGLDPRRFSYATFVLSSFLVGWIVAQCGVIGFVGIVVPAIARILVGVAHSRVLPISLLLGALLVVVCDLLGRVVIAPFEIPAGVFTSVLGGPAFVALLLGFGRGGRKIC